MKKIGIGLELQQEITDLLKVFFSHLDKTEVKEVLFYPQLLDNYNFRSSEGRESLARVFRPLLNALPSASKEEFEEHLDEMALQPDSSVRMQGQAYGNVYGVPFLLDDRKNTMHPTNLEQLFQCQLGIHGAVKCDFRFSEENDTAFADRIGFAMLDYELLAEPENFERLRMGAEKIKQWQKHPLYHYEWKTDYPRLRDLASLTSEMATLRENLHNVFHQDFSDIFHTPFLGILTLNNADEIQNINSVIEQAEQARGVVVPKILLSDPKKQLYSIVVDSQALYDTFGQEIIHSSRVSEKRSPSL